MIDKKDPFDSLTDETLRRAEQMCAGLELEMSIDRRGRSKLYSGFITDLDDPEESNIPVVVAEVGEQPWFTLMLDKPLGACRNALLVFRMPPARDMKYLGYHKAAEPGKRGEQDRGRYVLTFNILRDARKG